MKNSAMSWRNRDPSTRSAIWLNGFEAAANRRERYGTVSHLSSREPKNSIIRLGRVEHVEGVPRRWRVDDDQVEPAGGVQLVEAFHRQVVVAVDEAAGDVLVERVGEHGGAHLGVGRMPPDQFVPPGLGVEHRRPQLAAWFDAVGGELLGRHQPGFVADRSDAERVGQPARRVDGEHEHATADLGRRLHRHRRRRRGLADTARPAHQHHLARRQQRRQIGASSLERPDLD